MSRKITANLYMTLDGRGAFPKYPGSDRRTSEPNEMWREMWLNRFEDVTTVVMGRRSFVGHRKVWTEKAGVRLTQRTSSTTRVGWTESTRSASRTAWSRPGGTTPAS